MNGTVSKEHGGYSDATDISAAEARFQAALFMEQAAMECIRPFYLLKPRIHMDGNQWCVVYGEDLQSGVAGFGNSPAKASLDFDKNWTKELSLTTKGELE